MEKRGGSYPGRAGRKPKLDKHGTAINEAEGRIRDRLPELEANLFHLANGGYERIEEEWQPAGLVMLGTGEFAVQAYPELPKDELVLVKRKISKADKDRAANVYLFDRVAGKPIQKIAKTDTDGNDIDTRSARERLASAISELANRIGTPSSPIENQ